MVIGTKTTMVPADYQPTDKEEFMNPVMKEYFREKLLRWRADLLLDSSETLAHLQEGGLAEPDIADRASRETDRSLELRTRDRERKLIKKIDEALMSLDANDYGFCETCGVEIGIRRLEARPTATLCIDCKVLDEIREKQMG